MYVPVLSSNITETVCYSKRLLTEHTDNKKLCGRSVITWLPGTVI